jgi:hypothetical protein
MTFVRNLFLTLVFALGLLAGLQVPGFVDQYGKRIDAHAIEAREQFKGFQLIADAQFSGDVEEMIAKHEASSDETFHAEAKPIKNGYERIVRFEREASLLIGDLAQRLKHIVLAGDRETILETVKNFTAVIVLDPQSLLCGGIAAGGLYLAFLILFLLCGTLGTKHVSKSKLNTNARREEFLKKYCGKKK